MIRIRTFRAPDDPEACEKFIAGHKAILEIYYGIIKISSDNNDWVNDPFCIVIIAEDITTHKIYGGARLQIVSNEYSLPIESAISKYDKNIYTMVANCHKMGGAGEICGLWNSKEVAGMGIGSHILVRVAIAISSYLGVKSIFALCAPATVKISKQKGFEVVTELGNNGTFYYPKDNFIATAMKLKDTYALNNLQKNEEEKILSLRDNLNQSVEERGPKGSFIVEYNLKLENWKITNEA